MYAPGKGLKMDVILDLDIFFNFKGSTAMILGLMLGYIKFKFQFLSEDDICTYTHIYIFTCIVFQNAHNRFRFFPQQIPHSSKNLAAP